MNESSPSNFLILGIARSGTTMLQQLLDQHSNIAVCPESNVFTSLYRTSNNGEFISAWHYQQFIKNLKGWLKNFDDSAIQVVTTYSESHPAYKGEAATLFKNLIDVYLSDKGKKVFGEKTPQNIHHIPLIRRVCPKVKLIVLVRHPYDVVCSIARLLADHSNKAKGVITNDILLQAAVFVKWGLEDLFPKRRDNKHRITIRYEDVLNNVTSELTRICQFLELEFEPEMLQFQTDRLLRDNQRMEYLHPNLSRQLDPGNTNKYLKILDAQAEQLVYRYLGKKLVGIPYEISDNKTPLSLKQSFKLKAYQFRFYLKTHLWKDKIIKFKLQFKYWAYQLGFNW